MAAVICCDQCLIIDLSLAVSRVFFSICYLELELYLFAYKVPYDMVNLTHVREYTWDQTMSHRLSAHAKIDVFIIAIRMFCHITSDVIEFQGFLKHQSTS